MCVCVRAISARSIDRWPGWTERTTRTTRLLLLVLRAESHIGRAADQHVYKYSRAARSIRSFSAFPTGSGKYEEEREREREREIGGACES